MKCKPGLKYEHAADLYERIGDWQLAAECFCEAKKWTKAADIFRKIHQWRRAAECYKETKNWAEAAEMYASDHDLSNALAACKEGVLYRLGVDIANREQFTTAAVGTSINNKNHPDQMLRIEFIRAATDFFMKNSNLDEMMYFLQLQDLKLRIQYLERRSLFGLLIQVYEDGK